MRAAQEGERKARAQGARRLLAEARILEAAALQSLGQTPRAKDAALEARAICTVLGDQICVARTLARLGILAIGSNLADAEKLFHESYETAQRAGSYYAANALSNLAGIYSLEGDCTRAERALAEAAEGAENAGDRAFLLRLTINREGPLLQAGKLDSAEAACRRAAAMMRQGDNQVSLPANLLNLSAVLEAKGDLAGAIQSRQEWLAFDRASGSAEAWSALAGIAHTLLVRGDLDAARQTFAQAEKEARKAGSDNFRSEWASDLAELAGEDGRPAEGEALARQAEERSKSRNRFDDAASASSALASSLLAEGKVAEAQAAINRARGYLAGRCAAIANLELSVTASQIQSAAGDRMAALRTLATVVLEARRSKFISVQMDARLAVAKMQMPSSKARAELSALDQEARSRGYGLIARHAVEASRAGLPNGSWIR